MLLHLTQKSWNNKLGRRTRQDRETSVRKREKDNVEFNRLKKNVYIHTPSPTIIENI